MFLWRHRWIWPHGATVIGKKQRINGIGFGKLASGSCKVTCEARVDYTKLDLRLMQSTDEGTVVGSGGFTDDVDRGGAFSDDFNSTLLR